MKRITALRAMLAIALLASGCSVFAPGDQAETIAWIGDDAIRQEILLPDTFRVGVQEAVHFNSYGSSSCTLAVRTEVSVDGMVADITPLVRNAPPGSICTDDLRAFPHSALVRFAGPGMAAIRIRGRVGWPHRDTIIERQVQVR